MNAQRVVVMGLGNLLWADEGFGIRVAERLYARYHWPEEVDIVDGGTQGLNLLGYVEQASHLLLLDAIDYGLAPGSLRTYAGEKIPAYLSAKKMSLHQKQFFRSPGASRHPRPSALSHCASRPATGATGRLRR
ncbi:hydrogenase-1 operon protein HyaD [Salmonella enterica subsp. arizonae]|uniref:Hydrogenase-1 operon protein HyaD n=1 Tax=Salmonella enterica subsp. arizonae TaxID=59203 RepID=A0A379TA19_SALER|nr:hydrogenase-1 operon protein HyaD [Salmonella enterica subsp. arizonae]